MQDAQYSIYRTLAMSATRSPFQTLLVTVALTLAFCGCTKEARKERSLARANRDFANEKYDEAEIEYRKALQLGALDPTVIRQLGLLYFNEGRPLQAYAYLRKAAELQPENDEVRLKLGMCAMALGNFKEARNAAERVLKSQPATEDALMLLVNSSRTPSEAEDARQLIEKLRQQDKDRSEYHLALGSLRLAQHDMEGSERELTRALEIDSRSSSASMVLGEIFWRRHDLKRAEEALKKAADLAPLRSIGRLKYADFKVATGAVSDGKKLLDEINRKAPDYIPAWIHAMKLAFDERRYDDCAETIQRVLLRDPGNYDALLQRGDVKLAKGDAAGAIEEFERLDRGYNHVARLKYLLALAYLRSGENAKAENALFQAISIAPDFDLALMLMAELNLRKGNSADAVDSMNRLINGNPHVEKAYLILARAYLAGKKPDEALATYRRLGAIAPKDPQVPYLMGIAQLDLRKWAEARESFERSLAIQPDYATSSEMLINLDLAQSRPAAAISRVRSLIARYPKAPGPLILMEKIHLAAGDLDGAESDLLKAIDLDPNFATTYLLLARVYVASNKHQKALDKLSAYADRTNNAAALFQIGLIHQELKQYDAARSAYEKLLAVDSKYVPALEKLAILYCENLGQNDKALELARRAQALQPDDAHAVETLGWALYKRGEYHGALTQLLEAAEKLPADAEIRFHLGMAHYMMGEEDPARLAFQQVIAAGPDSPSKEEARRRLAVLNIDPVTADESVQADLEGRGRTEPADLLARMRLAEIQERKGRAGDAAANYEAALKLNPRVVSVILELVHLYSGPLHDAARARVLAKDAHEIAPSDPRIAHTLGRLLYQTGDYSWSLDLLQQAAMQLRDEPELKYDLARSYYSVGKSAEAEDTLKSMPTDGVSPEISSQARRLASMIAAGKDPAQAQASLSEAQTILEADPSSVPANMVLALAREAQGSFAEAGKIYEKILAQDSLFSPATRRLAILYAQKLGDDSKAYDLAVKARVNFPHDPELAAVLGTLDYRRSDYAGAVLLLQESLRAHSDVPAILFYIGMSHYQLKELAQGRTELQRALDLNLDEPQASEAKRTLDEMNGTTRAPSLSDLPIR